MTRALQVAALALLFWGCGARSMLGVPVDESGPTATPPGAAPGAGGSGGSLDAPSTTEPLLLYEPEHAPQRVLQGSGTRIVWTPERFAVLFEENLRGRIFLGLRFVEAKTLALSERVLITDEHTPGESPRSEALAWRVDELAVLWTDDAGALYFQRVGPQGKRPSLAERVLPPGLVRAVRTVLPTAEGFVVTLLGGGAADDSGRLLFLRLSPTGRLLGDPVPIPLAERRSPSWLALGDLLQRKMSDPTAVTPGGYALTYNERPSWTAERGERPDRLWLVMIDREGRAVREPTLVYEAADEIGGSLAAVDSGFAVSTWDLDRGVTIVPVKASGDAGAPVKLSAEEELKRPLIAAVSGGLAVLALSGELRDTNPIATDVHLLSVSLSSGAIRQRVHLNPASSARCAVEDKDFARQGDTSSFGIVWVEHCGERRMYFAREALAP